MVYDCYLNNKYVLKDTSYENKAQLDKFIDEGKNFHSDEAFKTENKGKMKSSKLKK